jgi:hypothetical protein
VNTIRGIDTPHVFTFTTCFGLMGPKVSTRIGERGTSTIKEEKEEKIYF